MYDKMPIEVRESVTKLKGSDHFKKFTDWLSLIETELSNKSATQLDTIIMRRYQGGYKTIRDLNKDIEASPGIVRGKKP